MDSCEDFASEHTNSQSQFIKINVIEQTRKIIRSLKSDEQKFQKAENHIWDALKYKQARPQSESPKTPRLFKILYQFQSSRFWQWILFWLGYIFMYMVVFDNETYVAKIAVQSTMLFLFWLDLIIIIYCKQFDKITLKYSKFFYFRILLLTLMLIDLIIFIAIPEGRPIRPFRILRAFVPMMYHPEYRKSMYSLVSAYRDIIVYFLFFTCIIVGWALIGCRAITFDPNYQDPNFPQAMDYYKTNYSNLGTMIFIVYVTATYDSYPDNQVLSIQNYEPNYIYYIVFIFLNMFLFSSIPGSLVYIKFRSTRSKIILVDEMKQQHSLVLAFVTLAEEQKNLKIQRLIEFLLYLYKYKIRYIEYITDICIKLDDNNNQSIQVNQFMQLSKIILENQVMMPPMFKDIQIWIKFRHFMVNKLHLKQIVNHWIFQLLVSIIIILSFINALFFMFNYSKLVEIFDTIFLWIFFAELLIRIIAIGPQIFFQDRWNNVDMFLVIVGIVFFFIPNNNNADGSVRIARIFRLASLFRVMSHSNFLRNVQVESFTKLKNIFSIILEILPIILKFFPLFLFFFYIFAIFAMEVFYNSYDTNGSPAYNNYQQYSSFRTFVQAQYIMVQVLTEAGWSQIAYDHAWRNPDYYTYVMLYFCLMHLVITYIIATLVKGIFWQVFFTVNAIFLERDKISQMQQEKKKYDDERIEQIQEINEMIANNIFFEPNTILKRQLYENKIDQTIFKRLKESYTQIQSAKTIPKINSSGLESPRKKKYSKTFLIKSLLQNWESSRKQLELNESSNKNDDNQSSGSSKKRNRKISVELKDIEEKYQEDFESEIDDLIPKIILHPKMKNHFVIGHPKMFEEFLHQKFKCPEDFYKDNNFDLHSHPLGNHESMYYHIYQIHALLDIETSKRQQKQAIVNILKDDEQLTKQDCEKLIKKTLQQKIFHIDSNGTLRTLFLSDTNEDLIKKYEVQYFSDLYGYSFKHINKMTLQPLLRLEANLTYSLRNILRYPQIQLKEFFQMLTHIEDKISNKLLQRGSLFKFVYKLNLELDMWFSIEFKHQQEMRAHFIKTGIWAYLNEMKENGNKKVYYARDVFNWDVRDRTDRRQCEKYIKLFFESFEGLAFSLLNEQKFFENNPSEYIYDLYIESFDVASVARINEYPQDISKIMVVILSKEELRSELGAPKLPYSLSDISESSRKSTYNHTSDFSFGDTDDETYQKLKNISAVDSEKIVDSEGLPFSYIVNLMKQIQDIIEIYGRNFIFHIERVLHMEFSHLANQNSHSQFPF